MTDISVVIQHAIDANDPAKPRRGDGATEERLYRIAVLRALNALVDAANITSGHQIRETVTPNRPWWKFWS